MRGRLDCLVIGGGPAGLTAAIYIARFRLKVGVVDAGQSRAALIPLTRNHAGFPEGIAGSALLHRMRVQALKFGAEFKRGHVERLVEADGGFIATAEGQAIQADTVLMATGVTNHRPAMSEEDHAAALETGRLRYCPVCDGYEVIGRDVAVIGAGPGGGKEALFLKSFTDRVTLIPLDESSNLDALTRRVLEEAGVKLGGGPLERLRLEPSGFRLAFAGQAKVFESVYPALGSTVHSGLATALGAAATDDGCLKVDRHQRTTVPGLYAAGDVVLGLDQISHAMGEAGVAATAIRNDLAVRKGQSLLEVSSA